MVVKWLIKGGCGYLGTSLIQKLLEENSTTCIRVLDNLSVGTKKDLSEVADYTLVDDVSSAPEGVELKVGDIRSYDDCLNASIGVDCVVHFAANTGVGPSVEDPKSDMEANIIGLFNALESARINGVKKFIFASSGAPIGELTVPPIHEELPAHPVSPYGASKLAGEGYCSAYYHSYGVKTISLRFGNVYGPRSKRKSSVVAKFIKKALDNEVCEIYGSGKQTRDFVYVTDLVDAVIKSSLTNVGGEVFQIASNKEVTINEIVEIIKCELDKFNIDMKVIHGETRVGDVMRNFSDTTKAKNVLGWQPRMDLSEGVRNTILDLKH